MRGIVIFAVCLVVLGGMIGWVVMHEITRDQGSWIPLAFGKPADSTIEMHIAVEMMTVAWDRPRLDERGEPLWDEWVSQHFDLRDASDAPLAFQRIGWSPLISEDKNRVLAEFYVKNDLQKGGKYTLDFIPNGSTQQTYRYRHVFSAPCEPQDMQRVLFKPVVTKPTAVVRQQPPQQLPQRIAAESTDTTPGWVKEICW